MELIDRKSRAEERIVAGTPVRYPFFDLLWWQKDMMDSSGVLRRATQSRFHLRSNPPVQIAAGGLATQSCMPWLALLLVTLHPSVTGAGDNPDGLVHSVASTSPFFEEQPPFQLLESGSATQALPARTDDSNNREPGRLGRFGERWLNRLSPSDTRFSDFISPVTNPVYFESPRTLTEARFLFLHQRVPASVRGGEIDFLGLQLRAALTERLSVISTKSGFVAASSPLFADGWADTSVGLKYNLFSDPETQRLLSTGITYEVPVGSRQTAQGNGSGLFDLFVSGGFTLGPWHTISVSGFVLPADRTEESSLWFWSNHASRRIGGTPFHVLGEVNWRHWIGAGENSFAFPLEGEGVFNVGSLGVAGNDILSGAIGMRYKPADRLEVGMAWEAPLSNRRDLLDNRLAVDCILRY